MTYSEALAYLDAFPDWERGTAAHDETYTLDRMRRLLELLDHPDRAYGIVHVVGTKGKGSTAAMIASCLQSAGYRTGLFVSPHLIDVRERVRVNAALISPEAFARLIDERLRPIVEHLREAGERSPLHFELLCALALEYFAQADVEVAVVEAGLGGRLDATNAVDAVALTAITTIGMDHTAVLGDTVAAIAAEKAAVVRPGSVVVSAAQPDEARHVIEVVSALRAVHLSTVGREWTFEIDSAGLDETTFSVQGPGVTLDGLRTPLAGLFQAANGALAVAALHALKPTYSRIDDASIRGGLAATRWPGRLQLVAHDPLILIDGAHNKESSEALAASLARLCPGQRFVVLLGVFGDKDVYSILQPLLPLASHFVTTSLNHPRALPGAELAAAARALGAAAEAAPSSGLALARARELSGSTGAVLVTGSLRTVGEVMAVLGIDGA